MPTFDTTMGGNRGSFPETVWSSVLSCADPDDPRRKAALNHLFSLYWRPIYAYVRASWGKSVEDAKDITQGFLCSILEGDAVSRYQPAKGRFRHYLKGSLRNFMAAVHREGLAQKRGGGRTVISLEVSGMEVLPASGAATPDELFDKQWMQDVMDRALVELKGRLERNGRENHYRVYEAMELHPGGVERPSYDEVARRLGLTGDQVRKYLHVARQELHAVIRGAVAEYVTSSDEIVEEMIDLFSG